ncbi:hypothetical protein PAMA_017093 [Pampus argenteus]
MDGGDTESGRSEDGGWRADKQVARGEDGGGPERQRSVVRDRDNTRRRRTQGNNNRHDCHRDTISLEATLSFIWSRVSDHLCDIHYRGHITSPPLLSEIPVRFLTRDNVKMIVLWVTLLVLHQGCTDALIPVITVQLGEPATLTCAFPNDDLSSKKLHWYKQSAGDNLRLIVTMVKSTTPQYAPEFSPSRFKIHGDKKFSSLTILRTSQEDEGTYHCVSMEWIIPEWSGTYLLIKGHSEKTPNYTVVQWPPVSDPVRPGDSVTLQCSVVSESQNKTCPEEASVHWYRAGSHASHPAYIYTDGNSQDICGEKPDSHSSRKSCVYHFSKNVSSSDAGTYYCAVATCGEILFGNGTKVEIEAAALQTHAQTSSNDEQSHEDYFVYSAPTKKRTGKAKRRSAKEEADSCVYTNVFYLLQKQK